MKLIFSLVLMLFSVLLIAGAVYLSLPAIVGVLIQSQLQHQGFDTVQVGRIELEPGRLFIGQLEAADSSRSIRIRGAELVFSVEDAFGGNFGSLEVEALEMRKLTPDDSGFSLPDPLLLAGILELLGAQSLPLASLDLRSVIFYDETAETLLNLSGKLSHKGNNVTGAFQIGDRNTRRYLLDLSMQADAVINFQLRDPARPDERILDMTIHSSEDGRALLGSFSLDNLRLLADQGMDGVSGKLRGDFSYGAGKDQNTSSFSLSLSAAGLSMGAQSIAALQLDARGSLRVLEKGAVRVDFLPQSRLQLSQFKQDDISVEQLSLRFPEFLRIGENEIQLADNNAARLDARNLRIGDIRLDAARFEQLSFSLTSSQCRVAASVKLQPLMLAASQLQMQALTALADCPVPGQPAWSLQLETPGISFEDAELQLAVERCRMTLGNSRDAQLLVESDPAELGGSLDCERSPLSGALSSEFRLNALNGVGRADYMIQDIRPDADQPLFSSLLKNWTVPLDIVSGEMQVQGRYRWWRTSRGLPRENLRVDVQLQDMGGHYEGLLFSGLTYRDSIEVLPQLRSTKGASRLLISDIDVGIAISGFASSLSFSPSLLGPLPQIDVDDLEMSLFDGKMTGERLSFDLNASAQDFELKVQGLDLAQLVALQKMEGLSASGRLDGTIPLRITPQGVTIREGRIFAEDQGGRIQYTPSKAVGTSQKTVPGSDKVLQVLEDLRYDSLEIGVEYSEQGDLQMQLALKGISPGVDPSRPVHFNLSLEQNLLTLLQGLRYAEGINRDIDRNVQKHFKQQQQ